MNFSIVFSTFRGRMLSHTRKVLPADIKEHERRRLEATPEYKGGLGTVASFEFVDYHHDLY